MTKESAHCKICGKYICNDLFPEDFPDKYKICCGCKLIYKSYLTLGPFYYPKYPRSFNAKDIKTVKKYEQIFKIDLNKIKKVF